MPYAFGIREYLFGVAARGAIRVPVSNQHSSSRRLHPRGYRDPYVKKMMLALHENSAVTPDMPLARAITVWMDWGCACVHVWTCMFALVLVLFIFYLCIIRSSIGAFKSFCARLYRLVVESRAHRSISYTPKRMS